MEKRKLVILTGPTAVGKTKLSIELAKKERTEIIQSIIRNRELVTIVEFHDDAMRLCVVVHIVQGFGHIRTILTPCTGEPVNRDVLMEHLIGLPVLRCYSHLVGTELTVIHCTECIGAIYY